MIFNPHLVGKVLAKREKDVAYVEVVSDMLYVSTLRLDHSSLGLLVY